MGADVTVIVILALLTIVTLIACIVYLCKTVESGEGAKKRRFALPLILSIGFVIRLIFALCIRGYREDYYMFTGMFDDLEMNGLYGYYKGDASAVLYPIPYFIYMIFGGLSNVTGLSDLPLGAQFMVKLPLLIADLFAAYGVYKIAKRYFNVRVGYVLAALVCVCPIFFVGSVVWTTPVVFTVTFIIYACYFIACKRFAAAIAFATAAAFSSKQGIYIFPIMSVFCVYHFIRAVINIRKDKPELKAIKKSEYCAVYSVPVSFVLSMLGAYLVGLFMCASYGFGFFRYIYEFLLEPLVVRNSFTYNGLSVYAIFGQNGAQASARFPAWVFMGIFTAIMFAVVCVVYFTKRNRATMVMLAAYVLFTMQVYYTGTDAIGMCTALPVLLAAYALVRDKRLLYVLMFTGIAFVINSTSVLAVAGYLNNLTADAFDVATYTGSTLLTGAASAVPIACSVIALVSHLYFTYVTVSIGMSGRKLMLNEAHGIGGSLKEFFGNKKVG